MEYYLAIEKNDTSIDVCYNMDELQKHMLSESQSQRPHIL